MAKYIPEVTIGNETYLLKDSEARETIERMDEIDTALDDRTNELLGYVNYGYDTYTFLKYNSSIAAYTVDEERNKTLFTLNGSPTGTYHYLKISNTMKRAANVSGIKAWTDDGFPFTIGHRYRIVNRHISGTCLNGEVNEMPSVYATTPGNNASEGVYTYISSEMFVCEFTATSPSYHIVMARIAGRVFTNFVCSVTIQDLGLATINDEKASSINKTVDTPAETVTITDAQGNMPMCVTVNIDTEQSSNDYDYPWAGGNGKNKFPNQWQDSGTSATAWPSVSFPVDLNTNESYIFSGFDGVHKEYIIAYDANGTKLGRTTGAIRTTQTITKNSFTADVATGADFDTISTLRVHMYDWTGVSKEALEALSIQCEIGTTATEYEPYENIGEIIGKTKITLTRTGKNLFNKLDYNYIDGYPRATDNSFVANTSYRTVYIPCKPNTVYTASKMRCADNDRLAICYTKELPVTGASDTVFGAVFAKNDGAPGDWKYSATTTTGSDAKYLCVWAAWTSAVFDNAIGTLQIEEGDTATEYVDGSQNVYEIEIPSSPGVIYGGILRVNKDGSGVLTKTHHKTKIGNWSWAYGSNYGFRAGSNSSTDGSKIFRRSGGQRVGDAYCTAYKIVNAGNAASMKSQPGMSIGNSSVSTSNLIIRDPRYDSYETDTERINAFVADMGDVEFMYKWNEDSYYSYQLSTEQVRTLLGLNNISCDTGDVLSVEYFADTKDYITDANNTVKDIISTQEAVVAKENHAVGDVFICGDKLYRATDAIATGETIAEGTNVASTITIGLEQVPLTFTNYIKSILLNVNSIGTDVNYLNGKVTDPDEAMSKNLYIQNGTYTYDYRTVEMKDGVVYFSKTSSSGSSYKSIWITGETMAGGDGTQNASKPPVGNAVAISTLDNINAVRVHLDKVSGSGYINVNIAYCTVDGDTVTLVGSKQVFGGGSGVYDYAAYLNIPETATHFAIQVYSSTTTTCSMNAYIRFSKELEEASASATGVSF